VITEAREGAQSIDHVEAPARLTRRRRNTTTSRSAYAATAGTMTKSATSPPGQSAPAPSVLQNTPNAVSSTPTTNFTVFSGTRDSGARSSTPVIATAVVAATAATTA